MFAEHCGPRSRAAATGARFLMDKFFVFRDDAPTDDDRRLAVLLLVAGVRRADRALGARRCRTSTTRGFWCSTALGLAGGLIAQPIGIEPAPGEARGHDRRQRDARRGGSTRSGPDRAARPAPGRLADNPLHGRPTRCPVRPPDFIDGVGSYHQKFQVVRRAPDPLGNRVIGYLGGIDINRNRLDTRGHHGSAWRPPDQVSHSPRRGRSTTCTPGSPDPRPPTSRTRSSAAGRSTRRRQPPLPPGSPPLPIVAFPPPTPTDDEVPPQPARHLVQVCRSGYAPEPGRRQRSAAVVAARRGDDPARRHQRDRARAGVHLHRGPVLHPARRVRPRAARGVDAQPQLRLVIVIPSNVGQPVRRHPPPRAVRAAPRRSRDRTRLGRPAHRRRADAPPRARRRRPHREQGPSRAAAAAGGRRRRAGDARPAVAAARGVPFWLWIEGERMLAVERSDDVTRRRRAEPALPRPPLRRRRAALGRAGRDRTRSARPSRSRRSTGSTCTPRRSSSTTCSSASARATPTAAASSTTARSPRSPSPSSSRRRGRTPRSNLRTALWAEHLGIPPAMGRRCSPIRSLRPSSSAGRRRSATGSAVRGARDQAGARLSRRVGDVDEDARDSSA